MPLEHCVIGSNPIWGTNFGSDNTSGISFGSSPDRTTIWQDTNLVSSQRLSRCLPPFYSRLAQLAKITLKIIFLEHPVYDWKVVGSNPTSGAILTKS